MAHDKSENESNSKNAVVTIKPLVAAGVDLRGYQFMPLYGSNLLDSDFNARASDAAFRAAFALWWAAWNQVPAASLPSDDQILCMLAGLGRNMRTWKKIKDMVLHGFVLCSDGRLYHRFLAPLAIAAWKRRLQDRDRKARYRATRRDGMPIERDADVPQQETGTGGGTGRLTGKGQGEDSPSLHSGEPPSFAGNGSSTGSEQPPSANRPKRRGTRLPDDWKPDEDVINYARERGFSDNEIADIAQNFRTYWTVGGGRNKTYADWGLAWKTWVRKERPRTKPNGGNIGHQHRIVSPIDPRTTASIGFLDRKHGD